MGQASKGLPTKSTDGRLGWRGEGLYKGKATIKNGLCNLRRKKKKKNTLYLVNLKLIQEHLILGHDRGALFLSICTFNLIGLNPINYDQYLTC